MYRFVDGYILSTTFFFFTGQVGTIYLRNQTNKL